MKNKLYETYFTEEQLANLRTHQIKELCSIEKPMTFNIVLLLVSGFWTVVYLVAFLIWFNKVTLFLTSISAITFVIFAVLHYKFAMTYKETIKKCKEKNHV